MSHTSTPSESAPQYPQNPLFITDSSLISLARHLRLLGHSVIIDDTSHQYRLFLTQKEQNRVLILHKNALVSRKSRCFFDKHLSQNQTRYEDDELHEPLHPDKFYIVHSRRKTDQLEEVTNAFKLKFRKDRVFSVCRACNGAIVPVEDINEVRDKVYESVLTEYAHFFKCSDCGKVYWGCDDPNDEAKWHTHYKKAIEYAKEYSYHGDGEQNDAVGAQTPKESTEQIITDASGKQNNIEFDDSQQIDPDSLPVMPVLELRRWAQAKTATIQE